MPLTRRWIALAVVCSTPLGTAHAQYADPPAPDVVYRTPARRPEPLPDCAPVYSPPGSLFRMATGPSLRVADTGLEGGLFVALDVGRRAAGFRASAAWMGVGREAGIGQYAGELWVDFAYDRRLHPLLGAGGGLARVDVREGTGELTAESLGIGVLRSGLQYELPVRGTDARAGVELLGVLPAVHAPSGGDVGPWLVAVAAVSIGF